MGSPLCSAFTGSANVAAATCSAAASSAILAGESFPSASSFSASIFCGSIFPGSIPSALGLAAFETAASTTDVSAVAAVVCAERSAPCSDEAFALAVSPASASLFSTAAAIAETPVIPTDSISPPGAAANVASNLLNISASSEIAASSVVNATGSATHRGPAAGWLAASSFSNWPAATTLPCDVPSDGTVETSAFAVAGVSKRSASASASSLGAGSSASDASGLEPLSFAATASAGALASAVSVASLSFATASDGFASIFSSAACPSALAAAANIGSSFLSTGAGSCEKGAVFIATATTAAGISG